jgi:hypothetical protein
MALIETNSFTRPPNIFPTLSKSKASTSYHFKLWPERAGDK